MHNGVPTDLSSLIHPVERANRNTRVSANAQEEKYPELIGSEGSPATRTYRTPVNIHLCILPKAQQRAHADFQGEARSRQQVACLSLCSQRSTHTNNKNTVQQAHGTEGREGPGSDTLHGDKKLKQRPMHLEASRSRQTSACRYTRACTGTGTCQRILRCAVRVYVYIPGKICSIHRCPNFRYTHVLARKQVCVHACHVCLRARTAGCRGLPVSSTRTHCAHTTISLHFYLYLCMHMNCTHLVDIPRGTAPPQTAPSTAGWAESRQFSKTQTCARVRVMHNGM
jgi:hypothetical protein